MLIKKELCGAENEDYHENGVAILTDIPHLKRMRLYETP